MYNKSILETNVITEDQFLDLSNAVSIYLKNIGSTTVKFGIESITGGKELRVDLNNTMLVEGTKLKVSFSGNSGDLLYRIVRVKECACSCKK